MNWGSRIPTIFWVGLDLGASTSLSEEKLRALGPKAKFLEEAIELSGLTYLADAWRMRGGQLSWSTLFPEVDSGLKIGRDGQFVTWWTSMKTPTDRLFQLGWITQRFLDLWSGFSSLLISFSHEVVTKTGRVSTRLLVALAETWSNECNTRVKSC